MQGTDNKSQRRVYKDYEIFSGKIRLVRDGQQPTIIDRDQAIDLAKAEGKNLVQIAYNKNDFPHAVCKIIDYSKHLYEQKKREKEARKQARANEVDVKEVSFSIRIEDGDFNTKCNHIKGFLEDGAKVKICVRLLRREMNLKEYAKDMMKRVLTELEGLAELDQTPSFADSAFTCLIRRKK